jgi:cytochrome c oxidase subunit 2
VRRGSIVQLVLVGAVLGAAATAVAYFVPWLPTSASRERGRIDFVFWFVTAISIAIFSLVGAIILYSVVKFRARPDDDSDGPPIHGHTGLEIVWTAVPALLVTAISIVSAIVLGKNDDLPKNSLVVVVKAQQFAWNFKYPSYGDLTSGVLRLPLGKAVELRISSVDVVHSFWVPQFGQKQDALPGSVNLLKVTPDRLGSYPVKCTELCGLGHAVMVTEAVVMKPTEFRAWATKQQKALAGGGGQAGKAVFANNGCGACHTFKPAGATANVGPDLDKLPQLARQAGKPLQDFVRESIVKPNAYVQPGFPAGVMPGNFGELPPAQLDALVRFLTGGGGQGSS